MSTLKPVNQKSLYHSAAALFEKIMNGEIKTAEAEVAIASLQVMNRTFALEIKKAEVEQVKMRCVELKNFEEEDKQP